MVGLLFISCEYIGPGETERGFTTYVWFNPDNLEKIDISAYPDREIYTVENGNMFKIGWEIQGIDYHLRVEFPDGIIDKVNFTGTDIRKGEEYPNDSTFTQVQPQVNLLDTQDGKYLLIIYTDCYKCQ
ncbi:MAG: hypothetical protein CL596_05175 [Alteromonas sp.]|nr:hypothetical protein [Alteromonas sp.]|tara:strand:- start:14731 stop:15114 length:384 start_codon:yes stop_codon:yes gene_type:complete